MATTALPGISAWHSIFAVLSIIYDTKGACRGQYGCKRGLIWIHARADVGSREWAVMGFES